MFRDPTDFSGRKLHENRMWGKHFLCFSNFILFREIFLTEKMLYF